MASASLRNENQVSEILPQSLRKGQPLIRLFSTLLLVAISSTSYAQQKSNLLIGVPALAQELKDPKLVLLALSGRNPGPADHIPGTRLVSMEDFSTPMGKGPAGGLMLELPPADVLRAKFSALGVSDDSHIVVYADGTDVQAFPMTTRLIFTLQYLGLGDHTVLLNGGLQAWKKAGQATTTVLTTPKAGHLSSRPTESVVADAKLVAAIGTMPGYKLVDARAPVYFKGVEPSMGQSGHIPGAVNIPFSDMVDGNGTLDVSKISSAFRDAGIKPGDTVVTYCHIGAQATATLFAARLLGNPVLLYDGSWQDWTMNHRGPVVK